MKQQQECRSNQHQTNTKQTPNREHCRRKSRFGDDIGGLGLNGFYLQFKLQSGKSHRTTTIQLGTSVQST